MVLPADSDEDEARRIIEQLGVNDHRSAITDQDRVGAIETLTGLGLSAAQIQRRTSRPKAQVAAASTVTESSTARAAVDVATLTLEQGATLAEFEDDPEAVDSLMAAAAEGSMLRAQGPAVARRARATGPLRHQGRRTARRVTDRHHCRPTTRRTSTPTPHTPTELVNAGDRSDLTPTTTPSRD